MAHYTMNQLRWLADQAEQGDRNITSRDPSGHVTSRYPSLHQKSIREKIFDVVIKSGGVVSRSEIAKALGIKKTPWLHNNIETLVSDGHLIKHQSLWKNGVAMYYYEAAQ